MRITLNQDLKLLSTRGSGGRDGTVGELLEQVYARLRQVASRLMRRERTDHTLSPTAVVHEAVIRLMGDTAVDAVPDRSRLIAMTARTMRQVLIDHARRKAAGRRGGGRQRVPLDWAPGYFEKQGLDALALREALDRLSEWNERQAQVTTLRYFGGMTVSEVAVALGVAPATVERDWRLARAWIRGQLRRGDG